MGISGKSYVLCYGDSNTWGFVPGSFDADNDIMQRFSFEKRWPGILHALSEGRLHPYEEGLCGRTIACDDPEMPNRNGLVSLPMLLDTHEPLDLAIVFLGMNDCKVQLSQTAEVMCAGYSELIDVIQQSVCGTNLQSPPRILMVAYPLPPHEQGFDGEFIGATEKLKQLNQFIEDLANDMGHLFFNATKACCLSSIDGIHFDESAHQLFARHLWDNLSLYI